MTDSSKSAKPKSPKIETVSGKGGETHQQTKNREATTTTNFGVPVSDGQNSLRAGARGPTLLEDFVLREKIFHFDHERIPERIVHARGSGAHGYFECTHPIPELSRAVLFQKKGHKTPLFARFSTVAGGSGSVDTPRDVRGFAVKFYTDDGIWDLVGNNIPVFFIQDAIKFPDLIHSVKMEADRGYPQAGSAHDTFWDFVSLMPETMHTVMWAMSDRAIPRSLRMMEGFGVHTFRLVNARGEGKFVKFHWKPKLGVQSTVWDEAVKIAGADNDYHRRDLHEAIASGKFPEWDLGIQVFDEAWAAKQPYDVLDPTKLIPEEDIPVQIVGRMVLDRNPDNFFAETEQVAFLPSNIIPGIDFTNDPLLQGRLFSYLDTQKSRLGTTNFHQIPINAARCPVMNFQRDGMMQMNVPVGRANYEPNSLAEAGEPGGPRENPAAGFATFAKNNERNDGGEKLRVRSELFMDHYSQPRMYYRSLAEIEQAHLASSAVFELSKCTIEAIRVRAVSQFLNIDKELGERVAKGLGMAVPKAAPVARAAIDMKPSKALSIVNNMKNTLEGRTVGILFTDGSDKTEINAVKAAVEKAGGTALLIAPRVENIKVKGGHLKADGQLAGTPSCVLDAIALVLDKDGAATLAKNSAAVEFVMDAWGHLKAIGASEGAKALLERAGVTAGPGLTGLDGAFTKAAGQRFFAREPSLRDLA